MNKTSCFIFDDIVLRFDAFGESFRLTRVALNFALLLADFFGVLAQSSALEFNAIAIGLLFLEDVVQLRLDFTALFAGLLFQLVVFRNLTIRDNVSTNLILSIAKSQPDHR